MVLRSVVAAVTLALSLALAACAPSPDRLPTPARNFYYVMEDPEQQREFLDLEESERQSFLEKVGLWQRWLELSSEEREAIETGEIEIGFKSFAAQMAWGLPADVRDGEAGGRVIHYETYIRCTSGPKAGEYVRVNIDCDGTSSEIEIAIEADIITELKYLD